MPGMGPGQPAPFGRAPALPGLRATQNFTLNGVTRDSTGAVLGSCTVKLFLTATDTLVGTTTSDPTTGVYAFNVNTLSGTKYYSVAYKAGTPDIAGTSFSTLVPNAQGTTPARVVNANPVNLVGVGNSKVRGFGGLAGYDYLSEVANSGIVSVVTNLGCDGRTTNDMLSTLSVEPDASSGRTVGPPFFTEIYVDSLMKAGYRNVLLVDEFVNDRGAGGFSQDIAKDHIYRYCNRRVAAGWDQVILLTPARAASISASDSTDAGASFLSFGAADIAGKISVVDLNYGESLRLGASAANTNEGGTAGHYYYDTTHPNTSGIKITATRIEDVIRATSPTLIADSFSQLLTYDWRATVAGSVLSGGSPATNGQAVDSWKDQLGHAKHFAGTTTTRPLYSAAGGQNGHPMITHDGVDDFLKTPALPIGCFSLYVKFKATVGGIIWRQGDGSAVLNQRYAYSATGGTQIPYINVSSNVSRHSAADSRWTDGAWHLAEFHFEGTDASVEVVLDSQTISLTSVTAGDPGGQYVNDVLTIGANADGTLPMTGSYMAVGLSLFKHNAVERARVRALYTAEFA